MKRAVTSRAAARLQSLPPGAMQGFVTHFLSVDTDERRQLLHQLLRDWLSGAPSGSNHAGALHSLLAASSESQARLDFLEKEVAAWLRGMLAAAPCMAAAARVGASYLAIHRGGGTRLAEELSGALAAAARCPAEPAGQRLHDGLRLLAAASDVARAEVVPALMEARALELVTGRHDFLLVGGVLGDVDRLKALAAHSPYRGAMVKAFPSLEPAQPAAPVGACDVPDGFFD